MYPKTTYSANNIDILEDVSLNQADEIVDMGTNNHFLEIYLLFNEKQSINNDGIIVMLPNRSKIDSLHTTKLKLAQLPIEAKSVTSSQN